MDTKRRILAHLARRRSATGGDLRSHVGRNRTVGFGIEVESIGVKDIILPGDMKTILAKVVEAEKAAQANVIRRREEKRPCSPLDRARVGRRVGERP